ncbi:MAG: phosphoribosylglycinamide formyltransferase [Planctomycetaceae bacterium]
MPPLSIAVLISGGGTTLVNLQQRIIDGTLPAQVVQVIASKRCGGVEKALAAGLAVDVLRPQEFESVAAYSKAVFDRLRQQQVSLVVLGGFLSRLEIPADFQARVLNIHPALIPAFCGQGMYGDRVHQAVLDRGCKVSGCTIHFCDNEYDHGPIVLQRCVPVLDDDDVHSLQARVFAAECEAYPEAIRLFAEGRLVVVDRLVRILT